MPGLAWSLKNAKLPKEFQRFVKLEEQNHIYFGSVFLAHMGHWNGPFPFDAHLVIPMLVTFVPRKISDLPRTVPYDELMVRDTGTNQKMITFWRKGSGIGFSHAYLKRRYQVVMISYATQDTKHGVDCGSVPLELLIGNPTG